MESQSKKNQVKHGKYGSIMPPTHFPSEAIIIWSLVTRGLLPHVLESIHKIYLLYCKAFSKTAKEGVGLFVSPFITLPCSFQKRPSSFLHFGQVENIHGTYLKKNFLICFSPLSLQAEQKEDDEHFANHLQMYVSRTFTKAKKSVICSEYPMSSKFHLSKWKSYFSQFIDKFLKIEL